MQYNRELVLSVPPRDITTDQIKALLGAYVHSCVFIVAGLAVFCLTQGRNAEEVLLKHCSNISNII